MRAPKYRNGSLERLASDPLPLMTVNDLRVCRRQFAQRLSLSDRVTIRKTTSGDQPALAMKSTNAECAAASLFD
jgi:hypothetical protein